MDSSLYARNIPLCEYVKKGKLNKVEMLDSKSFIRGILINYLQKKSLTQIIQHIIDALN